MVLPLIIGGSGLLRLLPRLHLTRGADVRDDAAPSRVPTLGRVRRRSLATADSGAWPLRWATTGQRTGERLR
jgi:hypothetical protein